MTDKIGIYDHTVGEQIVREMTAEEQTERDSEVAAYLASEKEKELLAKQIEAQRIALLQKLGITEEEAKLLLG